MTPDRRQNLDRRHARRLIPPWRALVMYLLVVISAVVIVTRSDARTQRVILQQCEDRKAARIQGNERNVVIRKDLELTEKVWQRIAAVQVEPHDAAEALSIAKEYGQLKTQVEDYPKLDCSELR